MAEHKSEPDPCQGHTLRKGTHDEEISVFQEERQCGLGPEVHVGLVEDHHFVLRVVVEQVPDSIEGKGHPGGCIGVRQDDPARIPPEVFLHADGKRIIEGNPLLIDYSDSQVALSDNRLYHIAFIQDGRYVFLAEERIALPSRFKRCSDLSC
jgi:hypothetical protein